MKTRSAAALAALALLSGCAPSVVGNELGGQVRNANDSNQKRTFAAAEAHCAQFGKQAKTTTGDLTFANFQRFECK